MWQVFSLSSSPCVLGVEEQGQDIDSTKSWSGTTGAPNSGSRKGLLYAQILQSWKQCAYKCIGNFTVTKYLIKLPNHDMHIISQCIKLEHWRGAESRLMLAKGPQFIYLFLGLWFPAPWLLFGAFSSYLFLSRCLLYIWRAPFKTYPVFMHNSLSDFWRNRKKSNYLQTKFPGMFCMRIKLTLIQMVRHKVLQIYEGKEKVMEMHPQRFL